MERSIWAEGLGDMVILKKTGLKKHDRIMTGVVVLAKWLAA
jgi:hypothetical protein